MASPPEYPYLQRAGEDNPDYQVSPKTMARLKLAADAIAETKKVIEHQGNQKPSIKATKMNSMARLQVMRDMECWEFYSQTAVDLANAHPEALTAAQADLAHGGNCGEHAWVAYHYLRQHATGEPINKVAKKGLDHAFVLVGDLKGDTDDQIAVSDPWVNKPMACLWMDHFAYTMDRKNIETDVQMVADGESFKEGIKAGMGLSAKGLAYCAYEGTDEEINESFNKPDNHLWSHDEARKTKQDYVVNEPGQSAFGPVEGSTTTPTAATGQ